MNAYRWTTRTAIAGLGFLAVIAVFVTVVRVLSMPVAGVQPEAFVLTAMMTAPFTIGLVLVSTATAALVETLRSRKNPAGA